MKDSPWCQSSHHVRVPCHCRPDDSEVDLLSSDSDSPPLQRKKSKPAAGDASGDTSSEDDRAEDSGRPLGRRFKQPVRQLPERARRPVSYREATPSGSSSDDDDGDADNEEKKPGARSAAIICCMRLAEEQMLRWVGHVCMGVCMGKLEACMEAGGE